MLPPPLAHSNSIKLKQSTFDEDVFIFPFIRLTEGLEDFELKRERLSNSNIVEEALSSPKSSSLRAAVNTTVGAPEDALLFKDSFETDNLALFKLIRERFVAAPRRLFLLMNEVDDVEFVSDSHVEFEEREPDSRKESLIVEINVEVISINDKINIRFLDYY